MLYGDDDTIWFVGGVLDLLKDLDPEMPYIITGRSAHPTQCRFQNASANALFVCVYDHTVLVPVDSSPSTFGEWVTLNPNHLLAAHVCVSLCTCMVKLTAALKMATGN